MFENRIEAGRDLGNSLRHYAGSDVVVCAIPRGGVPVAAQVAKVLRAPLDIVVVRKLGAPGQPELGIGAVSRSVEFLNESLMESLHVTTEYVAQICVKEKQEVLRREQVYRNGRAPLELKDKTIIIVDDGLATGVTAKTAVLTVKRQWPKQVIYASPVCASHEAASLSGLADSVTCLFSPSEFTSVGQWYKNFSQTTDEEVVELLQRISP